MVKNPVSGTCLKEDIASIRTNSLYHDLTIVCADGVEVSACRAVLAARCVVFNAILYGNMREVFSEKSLAEKAVPDRVILSNIGSAELNVVFEFIHTEHIDSWTDLSITFKVYRAANFFLLPKLGAMIVRRVQNIHDLDIAVRLLNDTCECMPWSETNDDLYNALLEPFRIYPLSIGDLNDIGDDALELLLRRTSSGVFNTSELELLRCVVFWAWHRYGGSTADEFWATVFNTKNSVKNILPKDGPATAPLLRMMSHIDLALICPHKLEVLMEAIGALADSSPQCAVFRRHACENTKCPPGHPSRYRGEPGIVWDQRKLAKGCVISEGGKMVEFLPGPSPMSQEARVRISSLRPTNEQGECEWDIIIESIGTYEDVAFFAVESWSRANSWVFVSHGDESYLRQVKDHEEDCDAMDYGTAVRNGYVVTVHLNFRSYTCGFSINGKKYGIAWRISEHEQLFVMLSSRAKYRIRCHV